MNGTQNPAAFRSLHTSGFILPGAWDAASARIFEEAGFGAVGTSSAAIAFSRGLPDGQTLSLKEMCRVVERIVDRVGVPVNADLEAGYGDAPADAARSVRAFAALGVAGVNLEDGTGTPQAPLFALEAQVRRLEAARAVAAPETLFLNARIDTYLVGWGETPAQRLTETLRRGRAYQEAGADGLFVPGVTDLATVRELAGALEAPLNVMVGAGAPPAAALIDAGARRVSTGPAAFLATLGVLRQAAEDWQTQGCSDLRGGEPLPFAAADALFRPAR